MNRNKTPGRYIVTISFRHGTEKSDVDRYAKALYIYLQRRLRDDIAVEIVIACSDTRHTHGHYGTVRTGRRGRPRREYIENCVGAEAADRITPHIHILVHSEAVWKQINIIEKYAKERGQCTDHRNAEWEWGQKMDYVLKQSYAIRTIRKGNPVYLPLPPQFAQIGRTKR